MRRAFLAKIDLIFSIILQGKLLFRINDQVSFFNQLCPKAGELPRLCLLTTSIGKLMHRHSFNNSQMWLTVQNVRLRD